MGVSLISVTSWAFCHHSFLLAERHMWFSHTLDQQNHGGRSRAVHSTGPRKCCFVWPKFWWLQYFFFPWTDMKQWFQMKWSHEWCREKGREMHSPLYVCNSVCRYVPIMCTYKTFAGCRNACCILLHICIHTNGLAPQCSRECHIYINSSREESTI